MGKKYYQIATQDAEASIFIYGDIVSEGWAWYESDVTSHELVQEIEALDVDKINVYINSYGGEVAEGWAICNALKRHKAKITTYCDGFACSAASLIFMAGEERIMLTTSALWIHNVQTFARGDHKKLAKEAEGAKKLNDLSAQMYLEHVNVGEDELMQMMDDETWITPQEALDMGFATSIVTGGESKEPTQSARKSVFDMILNSKTVEGEAEGEEPNPEPVPDPSEPEQDEEPTPEPEPEPEPVMNKPKNLFMALLGGKDEE